MRLLFITNANVGDTLLSSGAIQHLLDQYPGARLTVATSPVAAPLFEAIPGLERLHTVVKKPYRRHWIDLWRRVAAHRWEVVLDLRGSGIAYFLMASRRIVFKRRDSAMHSVEELADVLGIAPAPTLSLWLAPKHTAAAEALIPSGGPVLAIGPAANWSGKQWAGARFAETIRRLTGSKGPLSGARVAVLAAAHEREQAEPALAALPARRTIDLVGKVDLPTAAACLRRSALFIGNDSGLMHLAAAAGAPTLGLFGPSPEWRYRPWGANTGFVRTPESYEELVRELHGGRRAVNTLMDGLEADTVAVAAERLLRRTGVAA